MATVDETAAPNGASVGEKLHSLKVPDILLLKNFLGLEKG